MTPLFYQLANNVFTADFTVDETYLSKTVNGVRVYVPQVICNCASVFGGDMLNVNYDLQNSNVWYAPHRSNLFGKDSTVRGLRVTGNAGTLEDHTGSALSSNFFLRGWSMWLHHHDGVKSNFDPAANNMPNNAQTMRNHFRDNFRTGNKFRVSAAKWWAAAAAGGDSTVGLRDFVIALPDTDFSGLYFETVNPAGVGGTKLCFLMPTRPKIYLKYEALGADQPIINGRIQTINYPVYTWNQDQNNLGMRAATHAEVNAQIAQDLDMYILGPDWYRTHVTNDPYRAIREDSNGLGAVFQSIKRISQHVCAPVINPNLRIGASAPLNHDTRHLPPELRDFRLQLQDIDWGRLLTDRVTLNELTLYEFKGGNQKVGAQQNILYLPQFREYKRTVTGNAFEVTIFSELGSPSYYCIFCRSATTDILQQPHIRTLSIRNETTKKKSNTISKLSIGQMFHMTQRNVHPQAEYTRQAYNRRQTVLLSAEDVGLLGLRAHEYQKAKRVQYTFSGTTDRDGQLQIVLVYNNRGIHVDGRRLQVVTLHE